MHKTFLVIGSVLGGLSVALGAFGAHTLKKVLPADSLVTFETGVRYQFYHVFALIAVALLMQRGQTAWLNWAGWSFIIGILLFSGSLYLLAFMNSPEMVGMRKIGIITPFGGLFFIAGWVCMLIGIIKQ